MWALPGQMPTVDAPSEGPADIRMKRKRAEKDFKAPKPYQRVPVTDRSKTPSKVCQPMGDAFVVRTFFRFRMLMLSHNLC